MKKLTAAQQKVIDSIKASTAKFAGKTYEEVYTRSFDRCGYTKMVFEKAQRGFHIVYALKATINSLVKKGLVETEGTYSTGCQFVKLVTKAEAIEAMDDDAEDPSVTLDEFIAKAQEIDNMKEETTMKTTTSNPVTIDLTEGVAKFELNGTTYKYIIDSKRYAKTTADGKTKRIGKAEYDEAKASYDQQVLDDQPSRVEVENDLEKPAVLNDVGCVDCSKCNVEKCVHRDCMRRNPKNVGGLGECPRLDNGIVSEAEKVAEETGMELAEAELAVNVQNEQKKPRKARKSKDIAYEGHGKTLTAKQVDFLQELVNTDGWDGFDSPVWTDVLCDEIGGQFEGKPMTVGAMISTLCEKGLAERGKGDFTDPVTNRTRKSTYMAFTGLGQKIAEELGL